MKKALTILLVALIAMTAVFAQGAAETKSSGPMTITMLYAATQTEVGSLPDDWAGYQILRDKLGIDLQLQMLLKRKRPERRSQDNGSCRRAS